eukprot:TRINITY_DN11987_c0_g1_i4.p1 TRINITY_DN11987_c0_g1~~TRINITY_DN11987_c0_g1_i4.p1  ORF type:complete len:645 (-),score=119.06 TRINITY_DN11987_c0_g1_i4:16-1950(-)
MNTREQTPSEEASIPSYITEAALIISEALVLEAEEKYAESVEAYRSAIGKLLSEVQSDPDFARQASVKKRVAQYISKAEQLVERELDQRTLGRGTGKPSVTSSQAIPHLHLFSNHSELRQYKVIDILDGKVILAQHRETQQKVIFKALQKSSAVYKKSKTSLLPININFMVNLLKYWETEDSVFLMIEYCGAGKLWDLVQPLVYQQLEEPCNTEFDRDTSRNVESHVLKPSQSFILVREKSVPHQEECTDSTDDCTTDCDLGDMNLVHSHNNSLLVISDQHIQHYSMDEADFEEEIEGKKGDGETHAASQIYPGIDRTYNSVLERVCQMELSLKSRLSDLHHQPIPSSTDNQVEVSCGSSLNQQTSSKTSASAIRNENIKTLTSQSDSSRTAFQSSQNCDETNNNPESSSTLNNLVSTSSTQIQGSLDDDEDTVFTNDEANNKGVNDQEHTTKKLRKLSEMLPQFPDPNLPDTTGLPDRIIRLWAAELVKAITSLHYRDIIIKDLNPDNILLDDSGHLRLSYQCEWVSVERSLSQTAVKGKFIAPEILTPVEVTRSADWWSFGAILLLLYTGKGPSSLIPSGLDGTIPISFPCHVASDAVQFVTSLLQANPERRLGGASTGCTDIREHPYFMHFDWDKNMFVDK